MMETTAEPAAAGGPLFYQGWRIFRPSGGEPGPAPGISRRPEGPFLYQPRASPWENRKKCQKALKGRR